LGLLLPHS